MTDRYSAHSPTRSGGASIGSGGYWSSGYRLTPVMLRKGAFPLVRQARLYDQLRMELEKSGGDAADLRRITETLKRPVLARSPRGPVKLILGSTESVRTMLQRLGTFSLHWQVRRLQNGLPAFYLCRVQGDFWAEYRLVVEDLYRSPGYPCSDPRFVRLMSQGHETWFLCLSPFRKEAAAVLRASRLPADDGDVDRLLFRAGRHVLQAAWHEDQLIGVKAAETFSMPWFHQCIELLYLCLSGDLCHLRRQVDATMLGFFDRAYPQPAVRAFLERLLEWTGGTVDEVPRLAQQLYRQLAISFGAFLTIQVSSTGSRAEVPLYKLIFGNIERLDRVAADLDGNEAVLAAAEKLNEDSRTMVEMILDIKEMDS